MRHREKLTWYPNDKEKTSTRSTRSHKARSRACQGLEIEGNCRNTVAVISVQEPNLYRDHRINTHQTHILNSYDDVIPHYIYSSLANELSKQCNRSLMSDLHTLNLSGGENSLSLFIVLTLQIIHLSQYSFDCIK